MKKSVKIGLIIWASLLVAAGVRAGLTKLGKIPNWFDIEVLCHNILIQKDLDLSKFYREDNNCYTKCYKECKNYINSQKGFFVGGYCENSCNGTCYVPKWEKCQESCGQIELEGYSEEGYSTRCKNNKYNDKNFGGVPIMDINNLVGLEGRSYYEERINEMFSGYQTELEQYASCKKSCGPAPVMLGKPIIYLYPTTETEVHVQLGNPGNLSHTYPKYNSEEGRNVIAQPNGDLVDLKSGRELYSLYREGVSYNKPEITEGFVVKGEDTISFLEEKLAILGLNEHESEEFIVYWLPQMENNSYNLIRFETIEEQNEAMPLNITPSPDSVIRVMMDWKVLDEYVGIPEQELLTPERTGFVIVERGGSKLN